MSRIMKRTHMSNLHTKYEYIRYEVCSTLRQDDLRVMSPSRVRVASLMCALDFIECLSVCNSFKHSTHSGAAGTPTSKLASSGGLLARGSARMMYTRATINCILRMAELRFSIRMHNRP